MIDLSRGSGRTTNMLFNASISKSKTVIIVSPTLGISQHVHDKFFEMHEGRPTKYKGTLSVNWDDRRFIFVAIPHLEDNDKFRGLADVDVFWDHTVFEREYVSAYSLRLMAELFEHTSIHRRDNETT